MRRWLIIAVPVLTGILALHIPDPCKVRGAETNQDAAVRPYLSGNGFLNRGLYELAAAEYRKFLDDNEDHEKAPLARYGLGVALFRMGKYEDAAAELAALKDRSASSFPYGAEVATMLGQCRLLLKDYEEAAGAFERVTRKFSDHDLADEAGAGAVEAFYRAGEFADAVRAADAFVNRFANNPLRPRADFYGGLALMAREKFEPAAARFAEVLGRDPDGPFADQATLLKAQCHERDNAFESAIQQYRKVLQRAGSRFTAEALLSLGLLLHRSGELDEAGRFLDRLIEDFADSALMPAANVLRGRVSFDEKRYEDALRSFQRAVEAQSEAAESVRAEAVYWAAKCALRLGRPEDAAERLQEAVERYEDGALAPQMGYDLGVALIQAGDDDGAVAALAKFRRRFPEHDLAPDALHLMAMAEHRQRRYDRSLELCKTFLADYEDHPHAADLTFLTGENHFLSARYEPAAASYRRYLNRFSADDQAARARLRLGTALHRLDKPNDARSVLADIVDDAESDAALRPTLLLMGDIHFQRSEWKQAEQYLDAYLRGAPDAAPADDALLKLGLSLQRQSRPDDAVEIYDRLIERFPDSTHRVQAVFERGQALVALGRLDEAAAAFSRVLESSADSRFAPYALNHLASIASKRGRHDEAAKLYAEVARAEPSGERPAADMTAGALFLEAQSLMGAQKFGEAEASYKRFLQRHAGHQKAPVARAQLAIALARQQRCEDAVTAFEQCNGFAGDLEPSLRAAVVYEKAWCLRELGRFDEAAAAYRKLLDEDLAGPLTVHALLELAGIEQDAKRYDTAASLLRRIRETSQSGTTTPASEILEQCTYRLGVCEFELQRFPRAAALFEEFVAAYPESELLASAAYYAGESQFKSGRFEPAVRHLEHVVEHFENEDVFGPALLRLGESHAALQQWRAAEEAFEDYLGRFPESEHGYQARFGLGWAREHQKRYDEAVRAYETVVAGHGGPTAARAQFQIGECLFAQKKYQDAVRELLKVDILYGYPEWSAAALFEAGRCFEELNQTVEARKHFRQVAEKYKDTRWGQLAAQRVASVADGGIPGK